MDMTAVNEFAAKYTDIFLDVTKTREDIDRSGFADEGFKLGFGMDGGRKFIVSCPGYDAFYNVDDLSKVIGSMDNIGTLGSALLAKWDLTDQLDKTLRVWFVMILKRLAELTEEREPLTVQEIAALMAEHREEILEKTQVSQWELDCWIHEPTQMMSMDSGIAYDVTEIIGITIDDIIEAVEQEQMFSMMW